THPRMKVQSSGMIVILPLLGRKSAKSWCPARIRWLPHSKMRFISINYCWAYQLKILDFFILVDTKAKMSLKAETSKLYLSFLWWILEPILFVLVFYFVFSALLGNRQENFLLFLMCAKIPYMWFSKSVTSASGSIVGNSGIIS